jgi:hypothetical protein
VTQLIDVRPERARIEASQGPEEAESTRIGVGFSIFDSMGHALFRKTYSYDTGPTILRLGTTSRGKSSARAQPTPGSNRSFLLLVLVALYVERAQAPTLAARTLHEYINTATQITFPGAVGASPVAEPPRAPWLSSAPRGAPCPVQDAREP